MKERKTREKIEKVKRERDTLLTENKEKLRKGQTASYQNNCNKIWGLSRAIKIIEGKDDEE